MISTKKPLIYQTKNGALELRGDASAQIILATQDDLARLYEKDQSVISRHINNIFKDGEVDKKSNMQKMHSANSDKPVTLYSLDIILAVGYRANSAVAIEFRKWATRTLKQHITQGYTLNKKVLARNKAEFLRAIEDIKTLSAGNTKVGTEDILELVKAFSGTLNLLPILE